MAKRKPPRDPAGILRLRPHDKQRWVEDRYTQPAFQYADCSCITSAVLELRQPTAPERERLLGFHLDRTIPAVPSAKLSSGKRASEYTRKALLVDSFVCPVLAWLMAACWIGKACCIAGRR